MPTLTTLSSGSIFTGNSYWWITLTKPARHLRCRVKGLAMSGPEARGWVRNLQWSSIWLHVFESVWKQCFCQMVPFSPSSNNLFGDKCMNCKWVSKTECAHYFPYHHTKMFAIQKRILRGINFVKIIKKIFSNVDPESGHSCLVFVQYPRDSPRSAWELQKKIGAATNSRKKLQKNTKKTGGELICKHFGVNGKLR